MDNILTYIGTIASIGSIPLAIYFYIKSREETADKIRREILKIISYQIGENRTLNLFEIDKVINSNIRNNKLKKNTITSKNVIEDLISDTISSPLLDSSRKNAILQNLKDIFPNETIPNENIIEPTRLSTLFAVTATLLGTLTTSIIIIGEQNWSDKWDKFFNLNIVKGFWPNLLVGVTTTILSMLIALLYRSRKKKK
jgi:hypothetical protein